jgi:excisionase family DNA binding protein
MGHDVLSDAARRVTDAGDGERAALPDPDKQPTIRVEDAARALGISRSAAYEAVRRGEIPAIKIGHRIVVPVAALRRMLALDPEPRDAT